MPYSAALFRMELRGEEVVLLHGSAEGMDIFSYGSCFLADRHIEAVNEIDELAI